MAGYFFDTSALAKAYHPEIGTPKVLALLTEQESVFVISSLSVIEIQSVFSQKVRDSVLGDADYVMLKKRFGADIQSKRLLVKNLLRAHQRRAEQLLEKYARTRRLRTLDAIQLGAVLELRPKLSLDHFVCADKHLAEIARLEGLSVINPDEA